jgi:hypothetical protein
MRDVDDVALGDRPVEAVLLVEGGDRRRVERGLVAEGGRRRVGGDDLGQDEEDEADAEDEHDESHDPSRDELEQPTPLPPRPRERRGIRLRRRWWHSGRNRCATR